MFRCSLLALAVLFGAGPWARSEDPAKQDLAKFQGAWQAVAMHTNGQVSPQNEVQATRLVIEGNKFRLTSRTLTITGTFCIDPTKSPKTIDVVLTKDPGKGEARLPGIYEVKGGKRTSCFAFPGKERPTKFVAAEGVLGFEWIREPNKSNEHSAQPLLLQAGKLLAQEKPAEALKVFEKASALEPDNEHAVIGQFISLVQLKRLEEGAKVLDKWIQAKPAEPRRWLCKFMAEANTGQPEKALLSAEKLIELQPQEGANWVGKGQVLEMLKRDAEALQAFDKAVALSPKHEGAWYGRAALLLKLGKYDEAIQSLDKAIELSPQSAAIRYDRGCAHALKGDKSKAITDLKKAFELNPALIVHAATDSDVKSLRNDLDFPKLTANAVKLEMAKLQGTWKFVSLEVEGKPDAGASKYTVVLKGDQWTVSEGDKIAAKVTFKLDPTKNPQTIDLVDVEKNRLIRGIYAMHNDMLTVCDRGSDKGDRPTAFATKPDSGFVLFVMKRERP